MKNKVNISIAVVDIFEGFEESKVEIKHEITVDLNKHRLITLTFPISSKKDLKDLRIFCRNMGDTFKKFVDGLRDRYKAKDNLKM